MFKLWSAIIALTFALALAARPLHGDGWFWEIGNAVGFLALALLLVLASNGRGGQGASLRHRWLGIAVLVTLVAHIAWFLIGDPITWEYLKWGAPHYMVAGLMSAGLVVVVTLTSLISLRSASYNGYKPFQKWHRTLSIAILITALIHVALSGFYIDQIWQFTLLLIVSLAAYFLPLKLSIDASYSHQNIVIIGAIALVLFCLIRIGGAP